MFEPASDMRGHMKHGIGFKLHRNDTLNFERMSNDDETLGSRLWLTA
jgi:hypothetical protein